MLVYIIKNSANTDKILYFAVYSFPIKKELFSQLNSNVTFHWGKKS